MSPSNIPSRNLEPRPVDVAPCAGETLDSIGGVQILQREEGYRFNLDPLLLAHFAGPVCRGAGPVLDLGTGSGIIALLFAKHFEASNVVGLELQEGLFSLAKRNVVLNGFADRVSLVHDDLRRAGTRFAAGAFQHVVSNPPYRPRHQGRISPEPEKAVAKTELECELSDVVDAASHLLERAGTFHVILPASRVAEACALLSAAKLEPRRLLFVHPLAGRPANRVLIEAVKHGKAELQVPAPLVVHTDAGGSFTPEVLAMTEGTAVPRPDFA